ncbi:branched-chain amino acid ABC transporter permease [Spiractinospora alimapuensis]|uniref:branched-chain amino acid ABC transporter permease n=1 Tax=Spiractinospora alimapuensis TaxID=2820884 RepID=UPI001F3B2397|nr:branched-chain amino acid ABC transporter permease [Spiractinospora alimapuensis]QVQ54537.1 branched-chain amino acid ABC transporter permease [Spiractinospora alimapuensis]
MTSPMVAASSRRRPRVTRVALGVVLVVVLVLFPLVVPRPDFWVVSIGIRGLWLGIIALSLTWLAKHTGLLSLGQLTFWGVSAYTVAILATTYDLSYAVAIPAGVLLATAVGALVGMVAVRTQGVYFLMVTLAVSQLAYFLVLNAADLTRGHVGISVPRPEFLGLSLDDRNVFYYLSLLVAGLLFVTCWYLSRTPFGLALQGIRDSPDRMRALGYNVYLHRVAAFTVSSGIAAVSGVLALFYNGRVTPGGIDLMRSIEVLIVSVLGGIGALAGSFLGSFSLTTLQNFAQEDFIDLRRMTLTGLVFLLVLLFFRGGIVDLPRQLRVYARSALRLPDRVRGRHRVGSAPPTPPIATEPRDDPKGSP